MRRPTPSGATVDLRTRVGDVSLRSCILTASGTAGHGDELGAYLDLAALGAVVVKSQRIGPWPGNDPPRVHETSGGMVNSVGLQGPGVAAWLTDQLPAVLATGATVVASIWGRTVEEYAEAAEALAAAPAEVVAVEVNLSCPNLAGKAMFAQDPGATADAVAATAAAGRPRWAKLSQNVTDLPAIAEAAGAAGASAVVLINTLPAMVLDLEARRPLLGGRVGGLSGPAIHPVAVRAVWDVHGAHPGLPIVGVGGVASGADAVELMLAGASAVEVGTASFADPRAAQAVQDGVRSWCADHGVTAVEDLIGGAHDR